MLEGGACMHVVTHALRQLPTVCRLTLHRLPPPATALVIGALQDAGASLTALSLERVALAPAAVFDLARALAVNTALRTLTIRRCALRANGLCELVEMLEENAALRELDLSWSCNRAPGNRGGENAEEAAAWAALGALSRNTTLEVLNLRGCALGDTAVSPLAAAVAQNSTLRVLDVSCNAWSWRSAPALAAMLRESKGLQHVAVERCRLARWGALTLLRACVVRPDPPTLSLQQVRSHSSASASWLVCPAWPLAMAAGSQGGRCSGMHLRARCSVSGIGVRACATRSASHMLSALTVRDAPPGRPRQPQHRRAAAHARITCMNLARRATSALQAHAPSQRWSDP